MCFDLARDIDVHVGVPSPLKHRAVGGVTTGLINLGEEVTWEGRVFGVRLNMTSRITTLDAPGVFTDEMQRGPFKSWKHTHRFEQKDDATVMTDEVHFSSPFGALGALVDALLLKRFLTRFLVSHNHAIKKLTETR